jgi:Receptor family ligand binding region
MMDAVEVMIRGLTSALTHNPNVIRHIFRRGHVYYDDSRGIPCRREPMTSWIHGFTILNHLRRVAFDGLTGPVSFDPVTGHRSRFRLDVMAVSFDSEVRKV